MAVVLDDVGAHLIQIALDLGEVPVLFLGGLEQLADRLLDHPPVEGLHLLPRLRVPLGQLVQVGLQRVLDPLDILVHGLALFLVEVLKLFRGQRFDVAQGGQGEAVGGGDQGDSVAFGLLLDVRDQGLLMALNDLFHRLDLAAVLVAFEGGPDHPSQILDEILHVPLQLRAPSRGKPKGIGLVLLLEVLDIAPVVGNRGLVRLLLDAAAHERVFSRARGSEHEQVVAPGAHADTESDCLDRAFLADESAQFLHLGRRT